MFSYPSTMYPDFVIPTLQGSVLCEDVRREIQGVHTLVGVVNGIPSATMPIGVLKLCLWTRWCNGVGRFRQVSRILGPDEEHVLGEAVVEFDLPDIEAHATNVHFFAGLQFHDFGNHHIEIRLEDSLMLRFPLAVMRINAS